MKKLLVSAAILIGIAGASAQADPTFQSYRTLPKGSVVGNPWYYGMPPSVNSQAAANNGHLFMARGLDMNSTNDQKLITLTIPPRWTPLTVYVLNCSADPASAVGGIYNAPGKSGNIIVTAAQTYTGLSSSFNVKAINSANATTMFTSANNTYYFSLTTPSGVAGTCDLYIDGIGWP